ncbi:MAG: hypothetical protein ACKVII_19350 [Planctomycetales bacterium]|jgi:hypothetical protein
MPELVERINRLVEIARRLRTAADELGQIDLKSQIVDEISTLQEIRDELHGDGSVAEMNSPEAVPEKTDSPAPVKNAESLVDASMGIVEPTGKEETYSITPEEEGGTPPPTVAPDTDELSVDKPKAGPSVDERRAIIEMRIADLEQLEQAATRRMNDVPTAEQRQIKAKAQKAGREAGKSGKELQQYALGAMRLSPEQRSELQAARKDVLSLREAIEKERSSLESLDADDS